MKYLLGKIGNFYKANLHTHTVISDGHFTPEEIKKKYSEKGYSVVAFTDHNVIVTHNDLSDGNFLAITALEINVNDGYPNHQFDKTYHLNFYSKDKNKTVAAVFNDRKIGNSYDYVTEEMRKNKYDAKYSAESINEMIRRMNADGFLTVYNHPVWSLQNYTDYIDLNGLWGVEVYNSACDTIGLKDTDEPFIDLSRKKAGIVPVAADDTHNPKDLFGGFSMIESEKLGYNEILSAMERGDIYSSTGPLLNEITLDGNVVTVKCSPVNSIALQSERRWTRFVQGKDVTKAQFDLTEYFEKSAEFGAENGFIRVTLEDENGKKAWSRSYGLKELR